MCRYKTREWVYASIKQEKWVRAWRWGVKGHLWGSVNCLQGCLLLRAELLFQVHRWPPSSQYLTHCLFVSMSHWIRAHPWMGDEDSNISFLGDINSTHNNQCWEVGLYHLSKGKPWKVFDLGHHRNFASRYWSDHVCKTALREGALGGDKGCWEGAQSMPSMENVWWVWWGKQTWPCRGWEATTQSNSLVALCTGWGYMKSCHGVICVVCWHQKDHMCEARQVSSRTVTWRLWQDFLYP